MIGLKGIYVDRPEGLAKAWAEALAADRPTVIEVKTDPNVPPLPPHITLKEAKGFLSALAKGDSGLFGTLGHAAQQLVDKVRPPK
jgi:pyruvate dehydrogenase (quinone)